MITTILTFLMIDWLFWVLNLGAFLISAPNMEFSFTSREQAPPTLEQTEELIPQEITANHEEDIAVVAGAVPLSKHKPRLKKVKH